MAAVLCKMPSPQNTRRGRPAIRARLSSQMRAGSCWAHVTDMKESGETVAIVKPPATSSSTTGLAVGQRRCGEACPPLCWWIPHAAGYVSRGLTNGCQDRMESVPVLVLHVSQDAPPIPPHTQQQILSLRMVSPPHSWHWMLLCNLNMPQVIFPKRADWHIRSLTDFVCFNAFLQNPLVVFLH